MSRRRTPKKRVIAPDALYNSVLVHTIVNHLMKKGKKSLAYMMFYETLSEIKQKTEQDPLEVIQKAVNNVRPLVIVKSRRVSGSTRQVPLSVDYEIGVALAIRWILAACRKRVGKSMISKMTNEFLDASKNIGNAIRKKDEIAKMAQANRAYARF
uniref:Small ribosomal subunit protein uS7c n=1 Tax=Pleurastrum terricola TaxID=34116 RepID=RR7_PLETE|nr:ribosomal protein S7 [Pleurastrum terricola]A6YGB1.1 RecName: Full=Small ribosomal subunit protein uS7c; AltName: Full=30S ribosomal protein S7, chloroplastic [Pleurastrum terricola]ABO69325.1 ribosomal protein S7 [Pleurastrum terricola]